MLAVMKSYRTVSIGSKREGCYWKCGRNLLPATEIQIFEIFVKLDSQIRRIIVISEDQQDRLDNFCYL